MPTDTWDETNPADTDLLSAGASVIRKLKLDIRERIQSFITWGVSAGSDGALVAGIQFVPSGTVSDWAGTGAIPTGWLLCDGSAVSRTTYAALFAAISTTYGAGDGTTTFNLPDPRGRAVIGAGLGSGLTNRVVAATGGEETHLLTAAELPAHNHPLDVATGGVSGSANSAVQGGPAGNVINTDSSPIGVTHNNMQPFLVLRKIIAT